MFLWILYFLFCFFVIGFFVYWCVTRAILFSRFVMAFCIAILLSNKDYELVPGQGFLNFLAWAFVSFGVIYFITILPRVDFSMRFLCSIIVTLFSMEFLAILIGSIANDLAMFEITVFHSIINKLITIAISVLSIIGSGKKFESESSDNLLVRILDRSLASLLYTVSIMILAVPFHGGWEISGTAAVIIILGGFVGTFIADVFLAKKLLFGYTYTPPEEIEVPK